MIDYATFQRIQHLHRVEQLTVAQIALAMAMDARTVRRWLDEPQFRARATPARPSKLDPYKAYIRRLLEHHPYSAAQLLNRLRKAGYDGGVTICCFALCLVESPGEFAGLFRRRIAWDDGAIWEAVGVGAVAVLMNRCCRSGEDVGARAPSVGKRWGSASFSRACPHGP